MSSFRHLARRTMTSVVVRRPSRDEVAMVRGILLPGEWELWSCLQRMDQRHSLSVLRRFDHAMPQASDEVRAAALLHDVGKLPSRLGVVARIMATLFGPRTSRFCSYLDHERIGLEMLRCVSRPRTLEVLRGDITDLAATLRAADDV